MGDGRMEGRREGGLCGKVMERKERSGKEERKR